MVIKLIKRRIARSISRHLPTTFVPRATYLGNNRILVTTMVGTHLMVYYVEADDRLFTPWFIGTGQFETNLTRFFLRAIKPDSHCLDVGANFGFFSCLMARRCPRGRVIGIEADPRIAELARDNLFINNLHAAAEIIPAAVSDSTGSLTLYRRTFRSGNTSIIDVGGLTTVLGEPPAEPFTIASTRIDDLADRLQGRVDFIKIDVEGAEPLVLAGARETIRRNRDISIVMEWSPGQIAAAGFEIARFVREIADLGLRPFLVRDHDAVPLPGDALVDLPYEAGILLRHADRG